MGPIAEKRWGFFIALGLLQYVLQNRRGIVYFRSVFGTLRTDSKIDKNLERFLESFRVRFKKY